MCIRDRDIVDGVLAVLAHGEAEVEVHLRVGLGVEEPARGVARHLVEQIGKADGLAGALAHAHDLAVAQELHELHEHYLEAVLAVEVQGVERAFEAGDVTMVVGAPDVYGAVKMPYLQLVAVVGDVGGEVSIDAVGSAENVVLEVELFYVLLALSGGAQLVAEDADVYKRQIIDSVMLI